MQTFTSGPWIFRGGVCYTLNSTEVHGVIVERSKSVDRVEQQTTHECTDVQKCGGGRRECQIKTTLKR